MTRRKLQAISNRICQKLGIKNVLVRELTNTDDFLGLFFGYCCQTKKDIFIYMRFKNTNKKRYTTRFLLSLYSHELAHGVLRSPYHGRKFKLTHRRIYRRVRKEYEESLF